MSDAVPHRLSLRRLLPLAGLASAGVIFVVCGGLRYLTFESLAEHRQWLIATVADDGALAVLGFIAIYTVLIALSVPGAALLTVAAGFLFGTWFGTAYALTGATLGAIIVFLAARAGLAGLAERIGPRMRQLEAGLRGNAFSYLLALRLIPVVPFWLLNLAAAAIGMSLRSYVAATFIGMIPATFLYASLGSGAGALIERGESPHFGIRSHPQLYLPLIGLAVLALLPVLYRYWRARARNPA